MDPFIKMEAVYIDSLLADDMIWILFANITNFRVTVNFVGEFHLK